MIEKSPILITGCARSGASMIAGAINICGAFNGDCTKKGLFENDNILSLEERFLESFHADPAGQYPLPDLNEMLIPMNWRETVSKVMVNEGYDYHGGQWVYKSSRIALLWPVWHYAFPNAKWIIVRRKTSDIINSCLKTAYMVAFTDSTIRQLVDVDNVRDGWLWWVHQYEQRFVDMMNEGLNCRVIWPERTVHGDYAQLYETLEWLGLPWKSEVVHFIDPLLWHSRTDEKRKEKVI